MSRPAKILTLDDSLTMRRLVEMVFKAPAFDLTLAETGEEGIAAAKKVLPDLILLDYVLPDMNGVEVCARLRADASTASIPVLVISGKGDSLRSKFADYSTVKGFVPKPFKPKQIEECVVRALSEHVGLKVGEESVVADSVVSEAGIDTKKVAGVLYACLKDQLAKIPQWLPGLGDDTPAGYFARKILTPGVVSRIVGEVGVAAPAPSQIQAAQPQAAEPPRADSDTLSGSTDVISLPRVLEGLAEREKTGLLTLEAAGSKTYIYIREGRILAASSNDPETESSCPTPRADLPADLLRETQELQRKDGTPVFVSLATKGQFATTGLADALANHTQVVLSRVSGQSKSRFSWRELGILPAFVDAHGRPYPLDLLRLEQMRHAEHGSSRIQQDIGSEAVFRRCRNFSQRIVDLPLLDEEKRVLTVVDGRHTIAEIADRGSLALEELSAVLWRMFRVGLVVRETDRELNASLEAVGSQAAGLLMVLDGGTPGVFDPLVGVLGQRVRNWSLLPIDSGADVVEQLRDHKPDVILLDECTTSLDVKTVAHDVRANVELCDTKMIAMIGTATKAPADSFSEAGFDLVLRRPFLIEDLIRFLRTSKQNT